jgi:hypothetical protein
MPRPNGRNFNDHVRIFFSSEKIIISKFSNFLFHHFLELYFICEDFGIIKFPKEK